MLSHNPFDSIGRVDADVSLIAALDSLVDEAGSDVSDALDDFRIADPVVWAFAWPFTRSQTRTVPRQLHSFRQNIVQCSHIGQSVLTQGLALHGRVHANVLP